MTETKHVRYGHLTVEGLMADACAEAGLADFGTDDFVEGLRFIVDSTNAHVRLNQIGQVAFPTEIRRGLVNRLRFVEDLKKHPEVLDERLDDPLIILGLPRTGTTKLHRMLAADPDTQSIKFWQTLNPSRMPNAIAGAEDPRIELARQAIAAVVTLAPEFMQAHPTQAEFPEEEMFLLTLSYSSAANCFVHPTPGYYEWVSR